MRTKPDVAKIVDAVTAGVADNAIERPQIAVLPTSDVNFGLQSSISPLSTRSRRSLCRTKWPSSRCGQGHADHRPQQVQQVDAMRGDEVLVPLEEIGRAHV